MIMAQPSSLGHNATKISQLDRAKCVPSPDEPVLAPAFVVTSCLSVSSAFSPIHVASPTSDQAAALPAIAGQNQVTDIPICLLSGSARAQHVKEYSARNRNNAAPTLCISAMSQKQLRMRSALLRDDNADR